MTNQELFKQYGTEKWVVEQNLSYLLMDFWEQLYQKGYVKESRSPINTIGVTKSFMNKETYCEIDYAEKSKMETLEANEIEDADFIELS